MNKHPALIAFAVVLLLASLFVLYLYWVNSNIDVPYSSVWPVSEAEFNAVMRQAQQRLSFTEKITNVEVDGPNDIRVTSGSRIRPKDRLQSCGYHFKRVNGEWKLVNEVRRHSIGWMFSEAA
jgi:hypothetical protein